MTIYLIRHGQSEFNVAYDVDGIDPRIHDARLTPTGISQAKAARSKAAELGIQLVIASPLIRALQTATYIFGGTHKINVMAEAREQLQHSCDIGHPPRELRAKFPALDFDNLADVWWHTGIPNDQGFAEEPTDIHAARVDQFAKSLEKLTPQPIAVVGHGNTFKALIGRQMDNCEIFQYRP